MKKLLLVLVAACGDNNPPEASGNGTVTSQITLEMPATLAPGQPLPISWTVTDATENDRVVLHVFRPGKPLVTTSAGYHFTGSAPGTLYAGTVAPDGSLSPDVVSVAVPATSGQVTIPLPASSDGDWRIAATLLRDDTPVALTSATTWVASPNNGLRLDISRTWARGDDVVRVGVRTLPSAEALRLSAWLTLPDGTITSLPGVSAQYVPATEGVITDELAPLLLQKLGAYGTGRYLVSARLETLAGEPRGSAGAMIQVCDEPGTITGTVAGGLAGAPIAAFDLEDHHGDTSEVADDGSFSLSVPAGLWFVVGAGTGSVVEVGCGATTTVALTASASARAVSSRANARTKSIRSETAPPTVVRFFVAGTPSSDSRLPQSVINLLVADLSAEVSHRSPGFTAMTQSDLNALASLAMMQMAFNTEVEHSVDLQKLKLQGPDFFVLLDIKPGQPDGFDVTLDLVNAHELRNNQLGRKQFKSPGFEEILDALPNAVTEVLGDLEKLRHLVDATDDPLITPFWTRNGAEPGDTIAGTIHIGDPGSGKLFPGLTLDTKITPELTGDQVVGTAVTDGDSVAHVEYTVATTEPPKRVLLQSSVKRKSGQVVPSSTAVIQIEPKDSAIKMQKPVLRTNGDRTTVTVDMPAAANHAATATSIGLAIDGPAEVRFDANGRARVDVVTDTRSGPAEVKLIILNTIPFAGGPVSSVPAVAYGYVVNPLDLSAFLEPKASTITGELLEVRGVVSLQGVTLPGVPVSLELVGEGTITTSAITDANGRFNAFYRAPSMGEGATTIKLTVVKDADVTEKTLGLTYAPPCTNCPIIIEGLPNIPRGASTLLTANQKVLWSTSRGTITADGQYTAPGLGGNNRITATSVANPAITKVFPIIEECLYEEVVLNGVLFRGDVTADVPWNPALVDPTCLKVKISLADSGPNVGALINVHQQDCGVTQGLAGSIAFRGPDLPGCSIGFSEFGQCGQLSSVFLAPDPNTDGMNSRSYLSFFGHDDPANPGQCKIDYAAQGTVTK